MKLLLLIFIVTFSYANSLKQEMFGLYQNKKYKKVCRMGFSNLAKYKRDEEFISLYAFSCLYSDNIDRLSVPVTTLKLSEEARANAAYFSVILMQKKLLYHALLDGYQLSSLKLPTTDYVLSKVFDLYAKLGEHPKRSFYLFDDPSDKKLSYKLYLEKNYKIPRMIIEEYYDTILLKRHIYW